VHCCKFLPQYMTTCLGIRNATDWADARSIERISCYLMRFSVPSERGRGPLCSGRNACFCMFLYLLNCKGIRHSGVGIPGMAFFNPEITGLDRCKFVRNTYRIIYDEFISNNGPIIALNLTVSTTLKTKKNTLRS